MNSRNACLLDGNLLVAIAIASHPHHARAIRWFDRYRDAFATCATTQGTLLRLHMQLAADPSATAAWQAMRRFTQLPHHEFWDDSFSFVELDPAAIQGHRQVTDAWLAHLARRRHGWVATLDEGFARLHPDVARVPA
jgi:toxin-antitoxin system PIN domain toxin